MMTKSKRRSLLLQKQVFDALGQGGIRASDVLAVLLDAAHTEVKKAIKANPSVQWAEADDKLMAWRD